MSSAKSTSGSPRLKVEVRDATSELRQNTMTQLDRKESALPSNLSETYDSDWECGSEHGLRHNSGRTSLSGRGFWDAASSTYSNSRAQSPASGISHISAYHTYKRPSPPSSPQPRSRHKTRARPAPKFNAATGTYEDESLLPKLGKPTSPKRAVVGSETLSSDPMTCKIMSLPSIVCRAANGDIFLVQLGKVQEMLYKKQLGPKDWKKALAVVADHASSSQPAMMPLDPYLQSMLMVETAPPISPTGAGMHQGSYPHMQRPQQAGGNGGRDDDDDDISLTLAHKYPQVDEEMSKRVLETLERIEDWKRNKWGHEEGLDEDTDAEYSDEEEEGPEGVHGKHLNVRIRIPGEEDDPESGGRGPAPPASPGTARLKSLLKNVLFAPPPERSPAGSPEQTVREKAGPETPRSRMRWKAVQNMVQQTMQHWQENERLFRKWHTNLPQKAQWTDIMGVDMYVKRRPLHNGAAVYELKCQEMGVVPSSKVLQQLGLGNANLAHCKLGQRGTIALAHALSVNQNITSLNLTDNGIDAKAMEMVLKGLAAGSAKSWNNQRSPGNQGRWKKLEALQQIQNNAAELNRTLNSKMASSLCMRSFIDHQQKQEEKMRLAENVDRYREKVSSSFHSKVTELDLSENPLGLSGARLCAKMLNPILTQVQFLTYLGLGKCEIPEAGGIALVEGLKQGNNKLTILDLKNNRLGTKAAIAFGELLEFNHTLRELDLSWNQIKPEGAKGLAKGLASNASLTKLNLSWNGLENEGVAHIGEMLQVNMGVRHLDLTATRLGPSGCVVLAEGIRNNDVLEVLLLDRNPVGEDGARHLMHAINWNKSIQFLGMQGSNTSQSAFGEGNTSVKFNAASPDGSYSLDLGLAPDRAIVLQLIELDKNSEHDVMRNMRLNGQPLTTCKKLPWPEKLPDRGLLNVDVTSKKSQRAMGVMDNKKFGNLMAQLARPAMNEKDKLQLVELFAPFNYFICNQVVKLLAKFSMGPEKQAAAALLLIRSSDIEHNLHVVVRRMEEYDLRGMRSLLGWYQHYRFTSLPTSHFELNLMLPVHHAIAVRMKDVAAHDGDFPNWLNIIYEDYTSFNKTSQANGPPDHWKSLIPNTGTLSFDFLVFNPGATCTGGSPMSDEELAEVLINQVGIIVIDGHVHREHTPDGESAMIAKLRGAAHLITLTCKQLVGVADCFKFGAHRVEACIVLYSQLVDPDNILNVLNGLQGVEQSILAWRLGPQNLFNPKRPTMHWILDCSNPHHTDVARKLINMAINTPDLPNMWNIRINGGKKQVTENANMWGLMTAENSTPYIEFDYIGNDGWECLGKTPAEVAAMSPGDRLELRTRQAARMEFERYRQLNTYFDVEGSEYKPHDCQTWTGLMQPLLEKAPWWAAWDRILRILVRFERRVDDLKASSPFEELFDKNTESDKMTRDEFEQCLKDAGMSKAEMTYYLSRVEHGPAGDEQAAAVAMTLDDFVREMTELAPWEHQSLQGPRGGSIFAHLEPNQTPRSDSELLSSAGSGKSATGFRKPSVMTRLPRPGRLSLLSNSNTPSTQNIGTPTGQAGRTSSLNSPLTPALRRSSVTNDTTGSVDVGNAVARGSGDGTGLRKGSIEGGNVRASVDGVSVRASVDGVSVRASVDGGNVRASVYGGNVKASADGGNVRASVDGGNVRAFADGGHARASADGVNVRASVDGANAGASAIDGESVRASVEGGNVRASVEGGNVRASVSGGNVRASVSGGNVRASVSGGDVRASVSGGDTRASADGGNFTASTDGAIARAGVDGGNIRASVDVVSARTSVDAANARASPEAGNARSSGNGLNVKTSTDGGNATASTDGSNDRAIVDGENSTGGSV